ncbi:hypothetical protein CLCHR_03300 [Clostridium chromiireducens]|uniref:Uncharacterized protein n=1 Tax=Clostridium chromiireducens TaxID=225345 RepID=A0A1V4J0Z8_9CLOT|nr:hypothetical protein CLCHR_03300 [Clostridium chromiireducens]
MYKLWCNSINAYSESSELMLTYILRKYEGINYSIKISL